MLKVDLHSHTNCSDGVLTPDQLLAEAAAAGIELFSITDHDTVEAYRSIKADIPSSLTLVPGIELSCTWRHLTVHIVGLGIDLESDLINQVEEQQGKARNDRFLTILQKLEKRNLKIDRERVIAQAGNTPGRPHIARYLVETGQVKSAQQAFDKYLGQGKIGDVKECWPGLEQIVSWIVQMGGVAVIAHPIKYKLTRTKLMELCTEFKEAGGVAIEVISGQQTPQQTAAIASLARQLDLLASVGSDFHSPEQIWIKLGRIPELPPQLTPVWTQL